MDLNSSGFNVTGLLDEVAQGWITRRPHPSGKLFIYNYSPRAVFKRHWTPETLQARGLILDADHQVRARPFAKFFNYGEPVAPELPAEPFKIYEKYDGALGILYHFEGRPYISTRGSFSSPEAVWASAFLTERYSDYRFNPAWTYLFEIIAPQFRIVVDYQGWTELVLLAVFDTTSGREIELEDLGPTPFPKARTYPSTGRPDEVIGQLRASRREQAEGYVIRFVPSSLRLKVKLEQYLRVHKLVCGLSEHHIWELLRSGTNIEALLADVPDEFHVWTKKIIEKLTVQHQMIRQAALDQMQSNFASRRDAAEYFKACTYPSLMFSLYDQRIDRFDEGAWRLIEPKGSVVFRTDDP